MSGQRIRADGFMPIEDYAVIGDGRSLALVAADGAVDWLAAPGMDRPPLFAALLDPDGGGSFALEPTVPYRVERRYLPDSNVLETTFVTDAGRAQVTDSLNRGEFGLSAWAELAREVRCTLGEVTLRWRVTPGTRLGRVRPWVWRQGQEQVPMLRAGDLVAAVVADGAGPPRLSAEAVHGEFTIRPGDSALLALAVSEGMPVVAPPAARVRTRLRTTDDAWRRWAGSIDYRGPDRELVVRSALVLKLFAFAPTGAMIAATTTSLPEVVGGERNYDYRYAWVRDVGFALEALIRLGLHEQAHATLGWLLETVARTAPDIKAFYGLHGQVPAEMKKTGLRGYRDSRPVHDGNKAVDQPQWGTFGDLLTAVSLAVERTATVLDPRTARTLEQLAERVCDVWSQPDAGIWELGDKQHYTISKVACWTALDRMIKLAERGQVAARDVDRWRAERGAIRAWVDEHCWSAAKRAYSFYAGCDRLDASLLLAGRSGFCAGDDSRFVQTVDAIRAELADGPLVYRYTGSRDEENAFLACSFWLVDALVRTGRADEAMHVWKGVTGHANDLGLLSEQFDPQSGGLRGNMPQALSHLALLVAACQLGDAGMRDGGPDADSDEAESRPDA